MALNPKVTTKHVLLVVGVAALLVAAMFVVPSLDRPSFTCGGSDCREWGRCTGRGLKCVVGSDADCRMSDRCRRIGDCALIAGSCNAASNEDCTRSEACKSEGRCDFWTNSCITPATRQAYQARDAAKRAGELGLTKWCADQFGAFDLATVAELADSKDVTVGWTLESRDPDVIALESGTATTQGRSLPAYVVTARFKIWNRDAGKRLAVCVVFSGIDDKEFHMWREVDHVKCDDSAGMVDWKKTEAFTATK